MLQAPDINDEDVDPNEPAIPLGPGCDTQRLTSAFPIEHGGSPVE